MKTSHLKTAQWLARNSASYTKSDWHAAFHDGVRKGVRLLTTVEEEEAIFRMVQELIANNDPCLHC